MGDRGTPEAAAAETEAREGGMNRGDPGPRRLMTDGSRSEASTDESPMFWTEEVTQSFDS